MNPLRALRQRLRHWFHARLPRTDTLVLNQRNVYILPTRAGWMLAFTLLLLLVGSINYQLNLGYLLTFLLAGSAVAGMHICHANLRGLALHLTPPSPAHAGQAATLDIRLGNERTKARYGIGVGVIAEWARVRPSGQLQLQEDDQIIGSRGGRGRSAPVRPCWSSRW